MIGSFPLLQPRPHPFSLRTNQEKGLVIKANIVIITYHYCVVFMLLPIFYFSIKECMHYVLSMVTLWY